MRRGAALLAASQLAASAWAGDRTGTAAARFLTSGGGARSLAMGSAAAAAADDADAVHFNPAGLTNVRRRSASFTHLSGAASDSLEHAVFAQALGHSAAWGGEVLYHSSGRLAHTGAAGQDLGGFSPSGLALSLGAARDLGAFKALPPLSYLSIGATLRYVESRVLDTARTWALDLGVLSPPQLDGRLRLAAGVKNLGGELKYESDPEPLPLEGRLGAALRLAPSWLWALDAVMRRDGDPSAGIGVEYLRALGPSRRLAARAGFNSRAVGELSGFSGFSFGAGWAWRGTGIDYGLLPLGPVGLSHRFTLRVDF